MISNYLVSLCECSIELVLQHLQYTPKNGIWLLGLLVLMLDWTCITAHSKDVYKCAILGPTVMVLVLIELVSQHTPVMSTNTILGVSTVTVTAGLNLYHNTHQRCPQYLVLLTVTVSAGLKVYQFTHQRCLQYLVLLLVLDWTCITAHTKDVYNTWRYC